ncbi:hypothetical protein Taro_025300 [Colocasia esculenta]|uniref:Uncharacterized protein n=1 Tax=Colocasia esculenta TaxID=4460 RepID=A0A843V2X5_COLES|nr:hypothetical protein [Colocasia esculenta]
MVEGGGEISSSSSGLSSNDGDDGAGHKGGDSELEDQSSLSGGNDGAAASRPGETVLSIVISQPEEASALKAGAPKRVSVGVAGDKDDKLVAMVPTKKSMASSESYDEQCRQVAENVPSPESQPSGCFSPVWVAFFILIGGLLLDVLISVSLGVSALPVNIIIGMRETSHFAQPWMSRCCLGRHLSALALKDPKNALVALAPDNYVCYQHSHHLDTSHYAHLPLSTKAATQPATITFFSPPLS